MTWFLNNNNPGAAEAAMRFCREYDGIDAAYFVYGDEDRRRIKRNIDTRTSPLQHRRVLLCDVVRVDGRVPNKDIVDVQIYPPLPDGADEAALIAVKTAMDEANSSLS